MTDAGLAHIEFGSDSFCDPVLHAYGKQFELSDIAGASELARSEGVDQCHFLILGGPGETDETLEATFRISHRLGDPVVLALVGMRIYPGTPLHRQALAERRFSDETDLLQPRYYLAPGLDSERVWARLREQVRRSPNWLLGDPPETFRATIERLRRRGVIGPMWSYWAMIQRLVTGPTVG